MIWEHPAERGRATRGALTIGLILVGVLTACGGGSSGAGSAQGSNDRDLQAARMAAIAGCQAVSTAYYAPAGGATADQLQTIQNAFNNTAGQVYPGSGPLLRRLLDASSPAAKNRAVGDLQHWCSSRGLAPQR